MTKYQGSWSWEACLL